MLFVSPVNVVFPAEVVYRIRSLFAKTLFATEIKSPALSTFVFALNVFVTG